MWKSGRTSVFCGCSASEMKWELRRRLQYLPDATCRRRRCYAHRRFFYRVDKHYLPCMEIDSSIKEVAEANGFTYILDVSMGTVLYYEAGEDVLPLVKAKLGL